MPQAGQAKDSLRLFFALVPDVPVGEALGRLAGDVAKRVRGRAVAATNVHLTLAFLGETPPADVARLCAIGEALPRDGFTLALDHVGSFRGSGVAWVGVREVPAALDRLQRWLGEALAARGFPVESRAFRAHVTLARKGGTLGRESLPEPIEWRVRSVALVASTLAPGGSVYRTLAAWPLSDPAGSAGAGGSPMQA